MTWNPSIVETGVANHAPLCPKLYHRVMCIYCGYGMEDALYISPDFDVIPHFEMVGHDSEFRPIGIIAVRDTVSVVPIGDTFHLAMAKADKDLKELIVLQRRRDSGLYET